MVNVSKTSVLTLLIFCTTPVAMGESFDNEIRGRLVAPDHSPPEEMTALEQANDETSRELVSTIRKALLYDNSLSELARNLTVVTTVDGKVVVNGMVDSKMERDRAEKMIRELAGERPVYMLATIRR